MRWATFRAAGSTEDRVGVVDGDEIFALAAGTHLVDLVGQGGEALRRVGEGARARPDAVLRLGDVALRPPIPRPPTIRDFSSFHEHISTSSRNMGRELSERWYEAPVFYFSSPNNLFGDGEVVRVPGNTVQMDFELEVAAVIGRGGMDIAPADALDHVAGYTILNDWSARDLQRAEMERLPIGPGKGKDASTSLGPWLVTPDELADRATPTGYRLAMTASVDGVPYSAGCWSSVYWSFAEMIAYASRGSPLVPGDVVGAGTVGTGCILELSGSHGSERYPWLKEGDEVRLEIERLGTLTNRIAWNRPPIPLRAGDGT